MKLIIALLIIVSQQALLFGEGEEKELNFLSTEKAFEAVKKNKGWILVYVDWAK